MNGVGIQRIAFSVEVSLWNSLPPRPDMSHLGYFFHKMVKTVLFGGGKGLVHWQQVLLADFLNTFVIIVLLSTIFLNIV